MLLIRRQPSAILEKYPQTISKPLLLTPGFSPVQTTQQRTNRFNGFECEEKPLKRLIRCSARNTGLKPCVNETEQPDDLLTTSQRFAEIIGTLRSLPHWHTCLAISCSA